MRSTPFHVLTIAALVASSVPVLGHRPTGRTAAQPTIHAAPREAAAIVDAFHAALARGDSQAAAALLADQALIFEEGSVEWTKAEYTAQHLPADAAFSKLVSSSTIRRVGNSTGALAWVATEGRMNGTYKGKAVDRKTTETMLLRRIGRTWKIVHIHWSSEAAS